MRRLNDIPVSVKLWCCTLLSIGVLICIVLATQRYSAYVHLQAQQEVELAEQHIADAVNWRNKTSTAVQRIVAGALSTEPEVQEFFNGAVKKAIVEVSGLAKAITDRAVDPESKAALARITERRGKALALTKQAAELRRSMDTAGVMAFVGKEFMPAIGKR